MHGGRACCLHADDDPHHQSLSGHWWTPGVMIPCMSYVSNVSWMDRVFSCFLLPTGRCSHYQEPGLRLLLRSSVLIISKTIIINSRNININININSRNINDLIFRWCFPSSLALEPSPHSPATISRRQKAKTVNKGNYHLLARYEHNLVRDTAIMAVAHLVWLLLALLLTFALLGLAQNAEVLQLPVEVFPQHI